MSNKILPKIIILFELLNLKMMLLIFGIYKSYDGIMWIKIIEWELRHLELIQNVEGKYFRSYRIHITFLDWMCSFTGYTYIFMYQIWWQSDKNYENWQYGVKTMLNESHSAPTIYYISPRFMSRRFQIYKKNKKRVPGPLFHIWHFDDYNQSYYSRISHIDILN